MDLSLDSPSLSESQKSKLKNVERLLGTDPAQADAEAAQLLKEVPNQPSAMLFQGIARRMTGRPAAAIDVLRPLCEKWAEAPMPHLHLGLAFRETGDSDSAVSAIRQATVANEQFSDAWLALADILTDRSDVDGADKAYGMYVKHAARDPRLLKPAKALRENQFDEAEKLVRSHLQHYPTDIVALSLLADIAEHHDLLSEAEKILMQCLTLAPGYLRARHNYAAVLLRQNRASEALVECDRLMANDSSNTEYRKLKAAILVRLRDYEESIELCEGLLHEDPDQPTIWTSLGHMLKSVGRREDCVNAYRKAISLAPHFGEPYWSLVNLKTFRITEYELNAMTDQLARDAVVGADRFHLHFAVGKALEQRGEFADSFQNYAEGNRLRLAGSPYNAGELEEHVRRSKALFTEEFFASRTDWGASASDPIFVVGLPRSGSTLVEQILASHSTVEGTMELPDIAAIAKSLHEWKEGPDEPKYPEVLATLDQDALSELGNAYIEQTRIQRKLNTPYFIDKMPNNFAHIGLIHLILPNAKIVDVRRHPLACGFSLFKEHFARAQNFSYSLDDIGWYYRTYVDLLAHFDSALPGRVHRVVYESLVDNTEAQIRELLEFCGLPFEEACLNFHENKRAVSTASSEQVREPMNRDGLDHWRNFEPWLEPLKEQIGSLVETYADEPIRR